MLHADIEKKNRQNDWPHDSKLRHHNGENNNKDKSELVPAKSSHCLAMCCALCALCLVCVTKYKHQNMGKYIIPEPRPSQFKWEMCANNKSRCALQCDRSSHLVSVAHMRDTLARPWRQINIQHREKKSCFFSSSRSSLLFRLVAVVAATSLSPTPWHQSHPQD